VVPASRTSAAGDSREGTVAVAAEVDPGETDFAVALATRAADLAEDGSAARLRRGPRTKRDDAEQARETSSRRNLTKRNAIATGVRLTQPIAPTRPRRSPGLIAFAANHDDGSGSPARRVPGEFEPPNGERTRARAGAPREPFLGETVATAS